jgi:hypothetical protein
VCVCVVCVCVRLWVVCLFLEGNKARKGTRSGAGNAAFETHWGHGGRKTACSYTWWSRISTVVATLHRERGGIFDPFCATRRLPTYDIYIYIYVTLRYVTLRYVTLRYVTLRYVTYIYIETTHFACPFSVFLFPKLHSTHLAKHVEAAIVHLFGTAELTSSKLTVAQEMKVDDLIRLLNTGLSRVVLQVCAAFHYIAADTLPTAPKHDVRPSTAGKSTRHEFLFTIDAGRSGLTIETVLSGIHPSQTVGLKVTGVDEDVKAGL